jgi:hypothetical protein
VASLRASPSPKRKKRSRSRRKKPKTNFLPYITPQRFAISFHHSSSSLSLASSVFSANTCSMARSAGMLHDATTLYPYKTNLKANFETGFSLDRLKG